jgi:hypothetical protein
MTEFHTDALRPSSLPTASLGRRPTSNTIKEDTDAELDKVAEGWNLRIDKEMKNLTGGLGELVGLADVCLSLLLLFLLSSALFLPSVSALLFVSLFQILSHTSPRHTMKSRS